ncbi:hypothetical protein BC834DRAFT_847366 [Gloeopeniophorella convolvens]|nr:hypothetical protein BC834DRAFT_847366 [Gloeopeniophorella convolvens]
MTQPRGGRRGIARATAQRTAPPRLQRDSNTGGHSGNRKPEDDRSEGDSSGSNNDGGVRDGARAWGTAVTSGFAAKQQPPRFPGDTARIDSWLKAGGAARCPVAAARSCSGLRQRGAREKKRKAHHEGRGLCADIAWSFNLHALVGLAALLATPLPSNRTAALKDMPAVETLDILHWAFGLLVALCGVVASLANIAQMIAIKDILEATGTFQINREWSDGYGGRSNVEIEWTAAQPRSAAVQAGRAARVGDGRDNGEHAARGRGRGIGDEGDEDGRRARART